MNTTRTLVSALALTFLHACSSGSSSGSSADVSVVDPAPDVAPATDSVPAADDVAPPAVDVAKPAVDVAPADDVAPPVPDPGPPADDVPAPEEDVPPPDPCGDGLCATGEDPCSCPKDCPPGAGGQGDACCAAADCAQPKCGPCCVVECQDFACSEDIWLDDCCMNGACEAGETWETCPEDCTPPPKPCGDGACADDEDPCSCPKDCPVGGGGPGDACCSMEDCSQPKCGPCCEVQCQDSTCTEPIWQEPCCWNGECEAGETFETCPQDCPKPSGCDDLYACESDADCTKTQAGCCPCSMGGSSVAVKTDCVAAWIDQLKCPPDLACLAWYNCDGSTPICKAGQCALSGGGVDPIE